MSTDNQEVLSALQRARMPKIKPPAKPIAKRSESLKEEFKGYKKQVKAFLMKEENLLCKIDAPGCLKVATVVHHVSGRIGAKLKDEKDWLSACEKCNLWVEENDSLARQKGFKKSKFKKEK